MESDEESLDPRVALERERKKLKEAKATIAGLVANIGEYKQVLDQEKSALEEEKASLRAEFEEEKAKLVAVRVSLLLSHLLDDFCSPKTKD